MVFVLFGVVVSSRHLLQRLVFAFQVNAKFVMEKQVEELNWVVSPRVHPAEVGTQTETLVPSKLGRTRQVPP